MGERSKDPKPAFYECGFWVLCVLKKRSAEKEFCPQYIELMTKKDFSKRVPRNSFAYSKKIPSARSAEGIFNLS